jgi:predicted aldo/keto reductase-like oxidoreductase
MSTERKNGLTRREVIRTATCTAAAVGLTALTSSAIAKEEAAAPRKPILPYGTLGRCRYPVTRVSFGAILLSERNHIRILKAAIDAGVNLVHTSNSYVHGKSVLAVGELFKAAPEYRDNVLLCLKSYTPDKETELTDMLEKLHTDHADVLLSTVDAADPARLETIQKCQDALKKKGLIRHTGFVCHKDMNGIIEMVLEKAPDYFDATLLSCAMVPAAGSDKTALDEMGKRFIANVKKLKANGVGILSMKSGAHAAVRKSGPVFQAHVKDILAAGADTVLTSLDTFEQVDIVKALKLESPASSPAEQKAAAWFRGQRSAACLMCASCAKACPAGIPVNDLMRVRMYHDEYGWTDHARAEFRLLATSTGEAIDPHKLAATCESCTRCSEACPKAHASAAQVQRIASLLA